MIRMVEVRTVEESFKGRSYMGVGGEYERKFSSIVHGMINFNFSYKLNRIITIDCIDMD